MIISANKNKYNINKMCAMLNISRSYYYKLVRLKKAVETNEEKGLQQHINQRIKDIYQSSKMMYGSRKIAACLAKKNIVLSPFKVLKKMNSIGLSSLYNKRKKYQPYKDKPKTKTALPNKVNQQFNTENIRDVITSDLTYVPYNDKYMYICFVIDLYNREIITHGVSSKHDSIFVYETLTKINLKKVKMFHSDRGSEFINGRLATLFEENEVIQSTSKPGCPYDNAVSENLFGIYKREWMKNKYESIEDLIKDVDEFVHNYNYFRIHSKLNYQTSVEYRLTV